MFGRWTTRLQKYAVSASYVVKKELARVLGLFQYCVTKFTVPVQGYISNARTDSFSLIADMLYIGDNAPRIARALFEIALKKQYTGSMECILQVCVMRLQGQRTACACYCFVSSLWHSRD